MKKNILGPYRLDNVHPGFSIDCVILSFHRGKIYILLNKFYLSDYWSLPGGFMFNDENSDQAASRVLMARTGLIDIFLKQFHLFSEPQRTIMEQNIEMVNNYSGNKDDAQWLLRRFVSLGYYALVKYDSIKLSKVKDETTKWHDIHELPNLYSDHKNIIATSFNIIRATLPPIYIGYKLLPEKFTITELRKIYEIALDRDFDRRNFQRKILAENLVIQLEERKASKAYNPPILYSINLEKIDVFEPPYL